MRCMCTNDENPYYHVRDAVTDLVVVVPERPVATGKVTLEENGGLMACPQKTFQGPRPLEHWKIPFWNMGGCCSHHLSLFSEGKLNP